MSARAYLASVLKRAAVSGLAFALFWSYFFAFGMHERFVDVLFPVGVVGVLWGGLMTIRMYPAEWVFERTGSATEFLATTVSILHEIGYRNYTVDNDQLRFVPLLRLGMLTGSITITITKDRAVARGPAVHLARLARFLSSRNAVAEGREISR